MVPTGDLGLDVLLGGGWRLVKRFEERESATVVVRGGAGAGKTLMGIQVALELAHALGGDVAVGCVEILPTEYVGQLRSARPSLAAERVATLPASPAAAASDGPRVYVALLDDLSPDKPDLVTALEGLKARVEATGGNPVAFVVDSLIEGYGLGASTPRIAADDVLKFAARYGTALVLCEEVIADETSPWVFAADTVLQLGVESRERGRWIEVRKHRFGPSATGRHELELVGQGQPEAFPEIGAWRALGTHALLPEPLPLRHEPPALSWVEGYAPRNDANVVLGSTVIVAANGEAVASGLAFALCAFPTNWASRVLIELDPSVPRPQRSTHTGSQIDYLPTYQGAARALRWIVDELEDANERRCLVVGDLALVLSRPDAEAWVEAIATITMLVSDARPNWTVIFFDGASLPGSETRARLYRDADVLITANPSHETIQGFIVARQSSQITPATWPLLPSHPSQAERAAARRKVRLR